MRFRRKAADDEVTSSLIDNGVFQVSESHQRGKGKSDEPSPYSFIGATKYAFVLTFMLWWLPIVGPMITGYVTGRRAGKPWIGILAAGIALFAAAFVGLILDSGTLGLQTSTDNLKAWLITAAPVFGPYFQFGDQYLTYYLGSVQFGTGVHLDIYILTLAFAYLGGAMALQNYMEMGYVARNGGSKMTVNFHNGNNKKRGEGIFRDRRQVPPVKAHHKPVRTFQELESVSDDDEIRSPVERGVERAQLNKLTSKSAAKKNVAALKKGSKEPSFQRSKGKSLRSNIDEAKQMDSSDWRFI
ncbi:MAG: hypothetical protein A4E32_00026 [Methanomassiliicoccales archaeon PtaU1.Bin124]|nr:MAG: hypothetical protein A4E32_00026 [Methanomassiliicoccales archaeon PtaU1.Bin124]